MKRNIFKPVCMLFTLCLLPIFTNAAVPTGPAQKVVTQGVMVVANRGDSSLTVMDAYKDKVYLTKSLPPAQNPAEPMYLVHTIEQNQLFVGDRANDRVLVLDPYTFDVTAEVSVGKGVFHMFADAVGRQLWVVNDIDKTLSVISPKDKTVIATIAIPADLYSAGGKPHDVVVTPDGDAAFVSIVGIEGDSDVVVKYSTEDFTEQARVFLEGKDIHLSVSASEDYVYAPTQEPGIIYVLEQDDLSVVKSIDAPGAHGAGMPLFGKFFYSANIHNTASQPKGVYVVNRDTLEIVDVKKSWTAGLHNIASTYDGRRIYVTHSIPQRDGNYYVSTYELITETGLLSGGRLAQTGKVPFGIVFLPFGTFKAF